MSGNSIGKSLVLTTFGESHGLATGGVLDGLPAGIDIDPDFFCSELNRRRTGHSIFSSTREEEDELQILSGVFEGKTTGMPIGFLVYNTGHRSSDYDHLKGVYRPSHADYTYQQKYGIRDHRGGGRASARETLARVVGGAFAKFFLRSYGIMINGWVSRIGPFEISAPEASPSSPTHHPSIIPETYPPDSPEVTTYIGQVQKDGDTVGGAVSCKICGVPAGLGEPVFDKLQADLAKAMLSIGAAKGFEFGSGFHAAEMKGSEHNDRFCIRDGRVRTATNHSGGIQGGISNGEDIYFRVAFKPVSSIGQDQETVNEQGETVTLPGKGRHDICLVPRAVPVVEAMAALVIADHMIRSGKGKL